MIPLTFYLSWEAIYMFNFQLTILINVGKFEGVEQVNYH